MDDPRKKRCRQITRNGRSVCGNIHVGGYPRHEFQYFHGAQMLQVWPLYIRFAGFDNWVPGCYTYRELSDTFAVELVLEGIFDFVQNGNSYRVESGEIFLVQLGADTAMSTESTAGARKQTVCISGALLPAILEATGLSRVSYLKVRDLAKITGYFDRAVKLLRERPSGFDQLGSMLAYGLLLELAAEKGSGKFPEALNEILHYMNCNLAAAITVAELCRRFSISSSGLFRLFKKHLGISAIDYLIKRRMEAAGELLATSSFSIKEIADKVGYRNALYFSEEFRRLTGYSPREFRRHKDAVYRDPFWRFPGR